jgi:hypothetical protein
MFNIAVNYRKTCNGSFRTQIIQNKIIGRIIYKSKVLLCKSFPNGNVIIVRDHVVGCRLQLENRNWIDKKT